jgi:hypothetical protein
MDKRSKLAMDKVRNREMSVKEAADTFSVPRSSLGDRLTNLKEVEMVKMIPELGWFRKTFTDELEEKLVSHTKDLDSQLMPLDREEFCILAYTLTENLKIPHRFNKQRKCAGKTILLRIYEETPRIILENFGVKVYKGLLALTGHKWIGFLRSWNERNLTFHPLQK